ncbi:hypothetical protein BDW74DRAFT_121131 [Aspergillus multicolor]|uniref:uncharacterized protein n=1 Tax=Aspergillus multicolor TaxID=41759 RepID=UPI003CCD3C66
MRQGLVITIADVVIRSLGLKNEIFWSRLLGVRRTGAEEKLKRPTAFDRVFGADALLLGQGIAFLSFSLRVHLERELEEVTTRISEPSSKKNCGPGLRCDYRPSALCFLRQTFRHLSDLILVPELLTCSTFARLIPPSNCIRHLPLFRHLDVLLGFTFPGYPRFHTEIGRWSLINTALMHWLLLKGSSDHELQWNDAQDRNMSTPTALR